MPDGVEMATLDFASEVIAEGFTIPWGIEVLADGEYLVTERMGELVYIKDGRSIKLEGVPDTRTSKADRHYGGLMDVSLHPLFSENGLVYIAYVDHDYRMVVARFNFTDRTIQDFEVVFKSNAFSIGSRIAWEDDSHLFVTHGMAGVPLPEPGPQDLNVDGGKIHRLMEDGSVPADNPILAGRSGPTSIWSYGHRDPQGLLVDKTVGVLYATEHGPLGGDELNIIEKGGNYGWPRFSYGLNYDGSTVGDLSEEEADSLTILPLKWWGPTFNMAPSGLERVTFPSIGTRLVWGSLVQQRLIAYDVNTGLTSVILDDVGRVRDVTQLPSGDLLVLVDVESSIKTYSGRVVKLTLK
jgi:glucose/arabinose dehydrogenase